MRKLLVSMFVLPLFPVAAMAAGQTKAGLWEMTMKSDAMKNMPKVSPQQMEQMRRMGIEMPQMMEGGMITRVCISRQMAERDQLPGEAERNSGCQTKNMQRSGSSYSADIVCDGPAMKGQGKVKGTFSGNESFSSVYDFKGTVNGQPVNQHQESSGRWISADCGKVKPIDDLLPRK